MQTWSAVHDGYLRLGTPTTHRRSATVDSPGRKLTLVDAIDVTAAVPFRLSWHLGPDIVVELEETCATLSWQVGPDRRQGRLLLPDGLTWTIHRAEVDPIEAWYSPSFGTRVPATSLVGSGTATTSTLLITQLELP